jgi:hypothetical protein
MNKKIFLFVIFLFTGCAIDTTIMSNDENIAMTTNHASLLMEPTWAVLFSGDDLENFNEIGGADWQLAEGSVSAVSGDPGFLVSKFAVGNFSLRATFTASTDTNSGIFIRCESSEFVDAESCYEINIFDLNQNLAFRTGSILRVQAPLNEVMVGSNESILEIQAINNRIQVWVNGIQTADVEDSTHTSGYIGLQYNTGPISFSEVLFRPE